MKNEIQNLISVLSCFEYEYEILENKESIFKSSKYDDIKNNSIKIDNIFKLDNKYYEYLEKKIELAEKYELNIFKDVTKYQNDIIKSKEDVLTTLPNRYAIELFLNNNIGDDFIAVICDLDDFKNINDTYGHQQGDVVLREFGMILKRLLSQDIFVGRYGGEEFVMFFKNKTLKYVKEQLTIIRKQIQINIDLWNDKYNIKFSSGIAVMRDSNLKKAITEGDMALYFVKNNGKNADAIYDVKSNKCYIIE